MHTHIVDDTPPGTPRYEPPDELPQELPTPPPKPAPPQKILHFNGFLVIPDKHMPNDAPRVMFRGEDGWGIDRAYEEDEDMEAAFDWANDHFMRAQVFWLSDGHFHAYCNQEAIKLIEKHTPSEAILENPLSPDPRAGFLPLPRRISVKPQHEVRMRV